MEVQAYPIFGSDGNVEFIAELLRDVTERRRAEEDTGDHESQFRAVFETARDCLYIKDRSGRYTHVNPAMETLFELPASQLIGKTDSALFGHEIGRQLTELDARVLGGEPVEIEQTRTVNQVPITFLDARGPLLDNSGEIIGLSGIARNITDRRAEGVRVLQALTDNPSPAARSSLAKANLAANADESLLILGEVGSGKEYLARYVHERSRRGSGPFRVLNCAALSERKAESELFGHEPGAFDGAKTPKRGLLELSEGGTVLLNEVGKLSPRLQSKLLAFLSTGFLHRVGGGKKIRAATRIMSATHDDLRGQVEIGRFREDLFSLLSVFTLEIPPLRARIEDMPVLAQDMLTHIAAEMGLGRVPELDEEALRQLQEYEWPGNIRELRNVLERAVTVSRDRGKLRIPSLIEEEKSDWSITVSFPRNRSVHDVAGAVKRSLAEEALRRANGKRQDAARLLGISRHAFLRLTKAVGLDG
ncbi:MAG: sigma 54-interacting transcriptional regulator [Deltaproteobacteria bacterium]